jgi:hypothetical protein
MKRNHNQAGRNASRHSAAPQPKTKKVGGKVPRATIAPNIALFLEAEGGASEEVIDLSQAEYAALKRTSAGSGSGILMFMANAALEKARSGNIPRNQKRLTFRFTSDSKAHLADLSLDERQSSLFKRAIAATGLTYDELLIFAMDRQLEAFFPSGDPDVFRAKDVATKEISSELEGAERLTAALRAVAEEMTGSLENFRESQPLTARGFLAELPGLFSVIKRLSISADVRISDALMHWNMSALPLLLESQIERKPLPAWQGRAAA